jgi:hypothetical protein
MLKHAESVQNRPELTASADPTDARKLVRHHFEESVVSFDTEKAFRLMRKR